MRGFCLVIAALLGVGRTAAQSAEQQMVQAKQAELAARIKGVLTLEDDRTRQDRCAHTTTGSNVEFQNCVASELAQTNRVLGSSRVEASPDFTRLSYVVFYMGMGLQRIA